MDAAKSFAAGATTFCAFCHTLRLRCVAPSSEARSGPSAASALFPFRLKSQRSTHLDPSGAGSARPVSTASAVDYLSFRISGRRSTLRYQQPPTLPSETCQPGTRSLQPMRFKCASSPSVTTFSSSMYTRPGTFSSRVRIIRVNNPWRCRDSSIEMSASTTALPIGASGPST